MKDHITAVTTGLFVEIGKVVQHMEDQAKHIAELEAQLAKASTEVAERNPFAYGSSTKKNCILSKAQFDNCAPKNRTEYDLPLYTDPQVTSTDKAYEALLKLQFEDSDSDYKDGYNRGVRAAANFAVSMNISVPQSAAPAPSEVL